MTSTAVPADVSTILDQLVEALKASAGANLRGVALYGGLAKGRYTPGISDVNVLVVVADAGYAALEALAPVLTAARRRDRVTSLVVTPGELAAIARLFPVMLLDLQAAHRVLFGAVGLDGLAPDPAALRLRLLQEMKNLELRFRRIVVDRGAEPVVLWRRIGTSLPRLTVTLESVLRLEGKPVPSARNEVLREVARSLGIAAERIEPVASYHRHSARPPDQQVSTLAASYVALLAELGTAIERRLS